jgi:hydroxyacylglutathione hydrolase
MRELTPLPALSDNYVWLADLGEGHWLVVDPGEAEPVERALAEREAARLSILLTHHHRDHVGGARRLRERWPARVIAPPDDRIEAATERVGDGNCIRLGRDDAARVIAVPGHTASHVAYVVADVLFCGDTLFSLGCGRLFEGTPNEMHASLSRLATLPPATRVCCGHEYTLANARFARSVDPDNPALSRQAEWAAAERAAGRPTLPSTIALERAANPFLRCGSEAIRRAVGADDPAIPDAEVFGRLRALKDRFAG